MKTILRLCACSALLFFMSMLAAGCTYNTYHEGDAPPGEYELKESKPVLKERVVERHYVVE